MKKKDKDVSPEMVMAWAEGLTGAKAKDTAKRFGVSDQTVRNWKQRVQDWVGKDFDIENYRRSLFAFWDLAMNSLSHNLQKNDVTMTVAYLKGLTAFSERKEIEKKITDLSDEELDEFIDDRCKRIKERDN